MSPSTNKYKVTEKDNYWKKEIPNRYCFRFLHNIADYHRDFH